MVALVKRCKFGFLTLFFFKNKKQNKNNDNTNCCATIKSGSSLNWIKCVHILFKKEKKKRKIKARH